MIVNLIEMVHGPMCEETGGQSGRQEMGGQSLKNYYLYALLGPDKIIAFKSDNLIHWLN